MKYNFVTTDIDMEDPRYIEYLKTTNKPCGIGYQYYCGDLFEKEIKQSLKKYAERNKIFLKNINHFRTFCWFQVYNRGKPKSMSRVDVGDSAFDAHLRLSGCYNSLMMELAREDLRVRDIELILNRINENKVVLETTY